MPGIMAKGLLNGSLNQHLLSMRQEFSEKMISVCEYLKNNIPSGFSFETPQGGYFIWITGPMNFNGTEFNEKLFETEKVAVLPGEKASSDMENVSKNSIRISIAFYEKDVLLKGVIRLCKALHTYE